MAWDEDNYLLDDASDFVAARHKTASEYVERAFTMAKDYLGEMAQAARDYMPPYIDLDYTIDSVNFNTYLPNRPNRPKDFVFVDPRVTIDDLKLDEITVDKIQIPNFTATLPKLNLPKTPIVQWPSKPGSPPQIKSSFNFPTKPSYKLPTAPDLDDIPPMPTKPEINIPEAEILKPKFTLGNPPETLFVYNEKEYQSALNDAIDAELLDTILNGGTGLGADIEEKIWQRMRDRTFDQKQRVHEAAYAEFAARGFRIPSGALAGRIAETEKEILRTETSESAEIAIEQARLALSNLHFALSKGIELETLAISHFNQVQNRIFEVAKYQVEAAINIFNARVTKYQAEWFAYKTNAEGLYNQIMAEREKLLSWKAEIEGYALYGELQKLYVEIYSIEIKSLGLVNELYKTELEATQLELLIENAKLQNYRLSVETYSAQLSAITERFNASKAQTTGELAKVEVFKTEAQAYLAEVQGRTAEADINVKDAEVQLQNNRAKIEKLRGQIAQYQAEAAAQSAKIEAQASVYGADVSMYNSDIELGRTKLQTDMANYSAQVEYAKAVVDLELREAQANMQASLQAHQTLITAFDSLSRISSQMVASSLSGVVAGAQVSHSTSYSSSHAYDETKSVPTYSFVGEISGGL